MVATGVGAAIVSHGLIRHVGVAVPDQPNITDITAGDEQIAVSVESGGVTVDTIYIVYKEENTEEWSDESDDLKVTGDGTVTITGLTNGLRYYIGIYAKESGELSEWDFGYAIPVSGDSEAADDNISVAVKAMKAIAVYWEPATNWGQFGKPIIANPTEIACRWEDVTEEYIDSAGMKVISKAKLIVDRDLDVGGVLMLGELTDIEDGDNPKQNPNAWEVRSFSKLPNLKGNKYVRQVYL